MIYDAVIIGAGPAGTHLAFLLAKNGKQVALVDRRSFPRDKLCGGMLTQKTITKISPILPNSGFRIRSADVYYEGSAVASLRLLSPAYIVSRLAFDEKLVDAAKSMGTHTFLGDALADIHIREQEVLLSSGKKLSYVHLIGADGALSKVRKLIGLPRGDLGFCVEAYVPWEFVKNTKQLEAGSIEIYYGTHPQGYGWIFPGKSAVVIGSGNLAKGMTEKEVLVSFQDFAQEMLYYDNVKVMGAYIPSGTGIALGTPLHDNLCLIGDAAGLIDPFTGEGLYYAVLSAEIAAKCIMSGAPLYPEYKKNMREIVDRIEEDSTIRDKLYCSGVLSGFLSSLSAAAGYSEKLIDETIIRYAKTYAEACEELSFFSR